MFEFFATRRSIRSERGVEVSIYGLTRSVADYQSFSNFSNTLSFFTFDCTFLGAFPDETEFKKQNDLLCILQIVRVYVYDVCSAKSEELSKT